MRIFKPEDKLNFGKYNGEDLRFVYTFDPKYVEWLIINIDYFAIDINDFKDRHSWQMEISGITSGERFGFAMVKAKHDTEIRQISLREYLKEFFPKEYQSNYIDTPAKIIRFKFSDESLIALKRKLN